MAAYTCILNATPIAIEPDAYALSRNPGNKAFLTVFKPTLAGQPDPVPELDFSRKRAVAFRDIIPPLPQHLLGKLQEGNNPLASDV